MLVIRPLQSDDLEDLYAMAQKAGKGLTTLPADTELLQRKIKVSLTVLNDHFFRQWCV